MKKLLATLTILSVGAVALADTIVINLQVKEGTKLADIKEAHIIADFDGVEKSISIEENDVPFRLKLKAGALTIASKFKKKDK